LGFELEQIAEGPVSASNHGERRTSFDSLALVPAAWIAACEARGKALPADLFTDPLDRELTKIFREGLNAADTIRRVFDAAGFGAGDAMRDRLIERTTKHLEALRDGGVSSAMGGEKGTGR
jgi:fructuronate reductase